MMQGMSSKTGAQRRAEWKSRFHKGHVVVAPGVFKMAWTLPLVANMVEGGSAPVPSAPELGRLGFGLAISPSAVFLAACAAFKKVYGAPKQNRSSAGIDVELQNFKNFSRMLGFDWESDFDVAHPVAAKNT